MIIRTVEVNRIHRLDDERRIFMNKFYNNYVRKDIESLEETILQEFHINVEEFNANDRNEAYLLTEKAFSEFQERKAQETSYKDFLANVRVRFEKAIQKSCLHVVGAHM